MKAFKVLRKFNGKKMKVIPNNPLKSLINTENQQFRFFYSIISRFWNIVVYIKYVRVEKINSKEKSSPFSRRNYS